MVVRLRLFALSSWSYAASLVAPVIELPFTSTVEPQSGSVDTAMISVAGHEAVRVAFFGLFTIPWMANISLPIAWILIAANRPHSARIMAVLGLALSLSVIPLMGGILDLRYGYVLWVLAHCAPIVASWLECRPVSAKSQSLASEAAVAPDRA
jgi:hypothetical protein